MSCIHGRHRFGFRSNTCYCGVLTRTADGDLVLSQETQKLIDWAKRVQEAAKKCALEVEKLKQKISVKNNANA